MQKGFCSWIISKLASFDANTRKFSENSISLLMFLKVLFLNFTILRGLIKGEIEQFIGFREIVGENLKKGVKGEKGVLSPISLDISRILPDILIFSILCKSSVL